MRVNLLNNLCINVLCLRLVCVYIARMINGGKLRMQLKVKPTPDKSNKYQGEKWLKFLSYETSKNVPTVFAEFMTNFTCLKINII